MIGRIDREEPRPRRIRIAGVRTVHAVIWRIAVTGGAAAAETLAGAYDTAAGLPAAALALGATIAAPILLRRASR